MRPNKLEGLSLATVSSQVLEFEGKTREHLSDASFLWKLVVLPANVRLDWKVIARYKHSSLFGLIICNKEKKFYNINTKWNHFQELHSKGIMSCHYPQTLGCSRVEPL